MIFMIDINQQIHLVNKIRLLYIYMIDQLLQLTKNIIPYTVINEIRQSLSTALTIPSQNQGLIRQN